jgi:5-methylthioribose kinase
MLMAMLHSSTKDDAEIRERYGDPRLFMQQRVDPYLHGAAEKNPGVAALLHALGQKLLAARFCLIHGDFSPKNIFLIPREEDPAETRGEGLKAKTFPLSHLMLLDFEVAFYGHPAFDVATLINHLLLKGFHQRKGWRPYMLMADNFWQTYRHTADPDLVRTIDGLGGQVLGALLLARIDGKSPAEYLLGDEPVRAQVRQAALAILGEKDFSLDRALDVASTHFDESE